MISAYVLGRPMPRFSSSRTSEPSLKRAGAWVNFCSASTPGGSTKSSASPSFSSGNSPSSSSAAAARSAAPFCAASARASSSPANSFGASSPLTAWYCSSQPENLSTLPLERSIKDLCAARHGFDIDAGLVVHRLRHLGRHEAIPNQLVQFVLLVAQVLLHRLRGV